MKKLFLDVETTGLNAKGNGIYQISGIVEIDNEIKEDFNFFVRPLEKDIIEKEALLVNNKTVEEILAYREAAFVKTDLIKIFSRYIDQYNKQDKFFFYAYNAAFDYNFFRSWWEKQNDKYFGSFFWTPFIDVMTIAGEFLKDHRPSMPNFKLMTVAHEMGIVIDEDLLHDSLYDIHLAKTIYDKINREVINNGKY